MKEINIIWEGPYNSDEINKFNNPETDYGLYQIYGDHILYGRNVLLYLGITIRAEYTFSNRVVSKDKDWEWSNLKIYLGRFGDVENTKSPDDNWVNQIKFCESLMIFYLSPAWNSLGIKSTTKLDYYDKAIINNIGNKMSLPEIIEKGDWSMNKKISQRIKNKLNLMKPFVYNHRENISP